MKVESVLDDNKLTRVHGDDQLTNSLTKEGPRTRAAPVVPQLRCLVEARARRENLDCDAPEDIGREAV